VILSHHQYHWFRWGQVILSFRLHRQILSHLVNHQFHLFLLHRLHLLSQSVREFLEFPEHPLLRYCP